MRFFDFWRGSVGMTASDSKVRLESLLLSASILMLFFLISRTNIDISPWLHWVSRFLLVSILIHV